MYAAEEMSNEAAQGIKKNNEVLIKNIGRMGDIGIYLVDLDANLTVAQKLLGNIKRKMAKNKYILYGTLFVLLLVVVFIAYTYLSG